MTNTGLNVLVTEANVEWFATETPGVAWRMLASRDEAGAGAGATVLIRMDPGCGYRPHRHLGIEEVLVLAGGYVDADGTHRAGDYVRYSPGSEHVPVALGDPGRPVAPDNPASLLCATARGGIELLDPRG
ncbi:MAG: hypothetical protein GY711_01725 [bacterium]|nr:hypothetical protein [bacterium]